MTVKVAINGFGRIGRLVARAILERGGDALELVAINDLADAKSNAWLFSRDSVHGRYPGEVTADGNDIVIDGKRIRVTAERDPANLPHKELGGDLVLECAGFFTDKASCEKHLAAGAKKVLISAPGKNVDLTVVYGVNHDKLTADHTIVSNASCTTNCLAPMAKVLNDEFGIVDGIMTTIHAYTGDQNLHDNVHKKDRRRARAAAQNMVPTSTGAAKAIGEVIPELKGKLDGFAMRVPTITGSATDLTVELTRHVEVEEINAAFKKAAESGPLQGRLVYSEDPIVSSDIITSPAACTFDAPLTKSMAQTVKIIGWYDNEYGYTSQLVDFADLIGSKL